MAYGIQVFDTNGTTTVLGETTRYINRLTDDVTLSAATTHTFTLDATGLSAANSQVISNNQNASIYNTAFNGTSGITITPRAPRTSISGIFYVVRF